MAVRILTILAVSVALLVPAAPAVASDAMLRGRITDPDGLPLPGVSVTVRVDHSQPMTAITDQDGNYAVSAAPGHAVVKVELAGFDTVEREATLAPGIQEMDFTLRLAAHQEQVTVTANRPQAVIAAEAQPDAPATVTREVVDNGMLTNNQYDDVLTLLPSVVRGPNGLISVGGARAEQGALFVNGFNLTDPVTGDPGLIVATEAVDSVDVYSGGYPAELGRASSGITSVHTRPGADSFHSSASSFFPRMNWVDGQVRGLKYWEPNVGASGPLVKERLYFDQAISYRFDRNSFGTVDGDQDQKFSSLATWTQLDMQASPAQHVTAAFSFNPQHTDYYNITAFTPIGTVPSVDRHAFNASIGDRATLGHTSTLDVRVNYLRTAVAVEPTGNAAYVVNHDLTTGNYFDHQDTTGQRAEVHVAYSWVGGRSHLFKTGATVGRSTLDGATRSSPVTFSRSDGTLTRTFQFVGTGHVGTFDNETALFVQDSWSISSNVTLDAGARYDQASGIGRTISPRMAWTIKVPSIDSTVSGSVGLFGDKLPLEVLAFRFEPSRIEQIYDAAGMPRGLPRLYQNEVGDLKMPEAARWDLEFDHHLAARWMLRVKYQERHGKDEPIVQPLATGQTLGVLLLDSTGTSKSRSLETTLAYRRSGGSEAYLSYVRSSARGNLNSFDLVDGLLREPFIQADAIGPLPADVPNRFLVWGVVRLPHAISVAPFLEVRNGFPYSAIDEDWVRVGPPNGYRFPWFGSLDLYVNKIFTLPWHLPQARIGFKCWSVVSMNTERDVQRDILRADFGHLYNAIPRDYGGVFELLWGRK